MNNKIKKLTAILALITIVVITAMAIDRTPTPPLGSVTLAWDKSPGTNVITNYYVYYGVASATYTNKVMAGTNLTAIVSNLVRGVTYYFAATAVDNAGLESDYSTQVFTTINTQPAPPPALNVIGSN